ncbi:unnamed protein product [Oikopleura dioica]|uniref:rRNA adenine N(6)-methyltransferase n=1 Tax=Oikopleura dioica TaxID=34765 RepID=E4X2T9_OIKDI|nr:unnamed protein product [Oikopleura dioica]
MGKVRRQAAKSSGKTSKDSKTVTPGASQGLVFNTSGYGQHILKNPQVVQSMVEKAGVLPSDTILEIGPGTGNMTVKLLEKCKKVIALEVDERMVAEVQKRVMGTPLKHKLTIINKDALKAELPFFDLVVANLPYAISSPITFKLLLHRPMFRVAVLMFQKEFADRLVAQPGDKIYSRLSVAVQSLARVDRILKVGKNNFKPPPKVESTVVRIEPRRPPLPINFTQGEWDSMLRICFGRKNRIMKGEFTNKKVLETLEKNFQTHCSLQNKSLPMDFDFKELVIEAVESSDMAEKRARQMDLDDFMKLLAAFNERGIHFA